MTCCCCRRTRALYHCVCIRTYIYYGHRQIRRRWWWWCARARVCNDGVFYPSSSRRRKRNRLHGDEEQKRFRRYILYWHSAKLVVMGCARTGPGKRRITSRPPVIYNIYRGAVYTVILYDRAKVNNREFSEPVAVRPWCFQCFIRVTVGAATGSPVGPAIFVRPKKSTATAAAAV